MSNIHRYYLSIPLNINDLNNIDEGILWKDIKFEEYEITKFDYNNLFNLFCQFDKPFDIIIDEYEENTCQNYINMKYLQQLSSHSKKESQI
jgi:hypothetical protein